jgi:hypothetical protein
MSEAEFDQLLDFVRSAVAPIAGEDLLLDYPHILKANQRGTQAPSRAAANDNQGAWPLLPFPDGWHSAC